MDECRGIVIAQCLGEAQSLIDRHHIGHIIVEHDLPNGDAQDIAVDNAHALDLPTRGMLIKHGIDPVKILCNATNDFDGIISSGV